jgi:hypothetical protein
MSENLLIKIAVVNLYWYSKTATYMKEIWPIIKDNKKEYTCREVSVGMKETSKMT